MSRWQPCLLILTTIWRRTRGIYGSFERHFSNSCRRRCKSFPWRGVAVAAILFAVHLTGWGRPIGAVGGWNQKPLIEWWPLDYLAHRLSWSKRSWGVIWLTLHGTLFGIFISLALSSFWPVILWACQGLIFYVVPAICLKLRQPATVRWPEYAMGVAYGLAVALAAA